MITNAYGNNLEQFIHEIMFFYKGIPFNKQLALIGSTHEGVLIMINVAIICCVPASVRISAL